MLDEKGNCLVSPEFNGDMGDEMSSGELAIFKLRHCFSEDEFREIVLDFIREYGYEDEYDSETLASGTFVRPQNIVEDTFQNINGSYFDNWFSDYLYVVNDTDADISTKDYNGADIVLKAGHLTVLDFGEFVRDLPLDERTPETEEG